jgi:hypothetical protein
MFGWLLDFLKNLVGYIPDEPHRVHREPCITLKAPDVTLHCDCGTEYIMHGRLIQCSCGKWYVMVPGIKSLEES